MIPIPIDERLGGRGGDSDPFAATGRRTLGLWCWRAAGWRGAGVYTKLCSGRRGAAGERAGGTERA